MRKIIIALVALFASYGLSAQEWKVNVGEQTPAFSVTAKDGSVITTESLRGKVVLVNFFATWCPPCRAELPHMEKAVWEEWANREDFELMILAREEGWDKIDPFLEKTKHSMPFYPDLGRKVFSLFAKDTIPRNMLIDRDGKIIYQSIGYSEAEFNKLVELIGKTLSK